MNAHYETAPRFTPAGVSTVAVLFLILTMGVSTLWDPEPASNAQITAAGQTHLAQAHGAFAVKKS